MDEFIKKPFRIRKYSAQGFEIFKVNPGIFIVCFILYLLIGITIHFVPFFGAFASGLFNIVFYAGITIIAHRITRGEAVELANGFDGFKKLVPLLIYSLIYFVVVMVLTFVFVGSFVISLLFSTNLDNIQLSDIFTFQAIILILLLIIVWFFISIATIYVSCFILFRDMDAVSAIKASFQLAMKNPFKILLFYIFWFIIFLISLIPLGLGMLISVPVFMTSVYAAWRDQSGFSDEDEDSAIVESLAYD